MGDNEKLKELGDRIWQLRKDKRMSQREFAEEIDLKVQQNLSNWEKGKFPPPAETLQNIASFCKVQLQWLMTGEEPKMREPETDHIERHVIMQEPPRAVGLGTDKTQHQIELLEKEVRILNLRLDALEKEVRDLKH